MKKKDILKLLAKMIENKGLNPNSPMINCLPHFPEKMISKKYRKTKRK